MGAVKLSAVIGAAQKVDVLQGALKGAAAGAMPALYELATFALRALALGWGSF
jgi:hypothetical protein